MFDSESSSDGGWI
jgi:casein kinase II subunit beta